MVLKKLTHQQPVMKNIYHPPDFDEIISRINKLTPDSQRRWGKMSVNEMICHITDQMRLAIDEKKTQYPFNPVVQFFGKMMFVYGFRFPKNFLTVREMKQSPNGDGTRPVNFRRDLESLIHVLNEFVSKDKNYSFSSHPAFGQMNRKEWGIMVYKHLDHHLRQFGV